MFDRLHPTIPRHAPTPPVGSMSGTMTQPRTPGLPDSSHVFGEPAGVAPLRPSRFGMPTHGVGSDDETEMFSPTRIVACLHFMTYTVMLDDANVLFQVDLHARVTVVERNVQSFGIRNKQHQLMIVKNNKLQQRQVGTRTEVFTALHGIVCSSVNTAICEQIVFAHNQKIYQYQPTGRTLILDANMPVDYFQMDSKVLLAKTQDCRFKVFVKTTGPTGPTGQFEPKYTINKIDVRASILQDSFTILMWRKNRSGKVITNSVDAQQTTEPQPSWLQHAAFFSQTNRVYIMDDRTVDVLQYVPSTTGATGAVGASDALDASGAPGASGASGASHGSDVDASGASDASDASVGSDVSSGHVSGTSSSQYSSVSSHDQTTQNTASGNSARAAQPAKRKVSCKLPTTLPKLPRLARSETVLCIDVLNNQLLVLTTKKASIYTLVNGELTQSKAKIIHVAAKLAKLLPGGRMLCLSDKLVLYTHHKHHKPEQLAKFAKTTTPAGLATHHNAYAIVALNPGGEILQVDMHSKQMNSFTNMRSDVVSLASLPDWLCVALHHGITVISWQDRSAVHTLRTNLANLANLAPSKLCSCDDTLFAVSTTIHVWTNQHILQTTRNQRNVIVDSEHQCEARRDTIIACAANSKHLFVAHVLQTPLVDKYTYEQLGMVV